MSAGDGVKSPGDFCFGDRERRDDATTGGIHSVFVSHVRGRARKQCGVFEEIVEKKSRKVRVDRNRPNARDRLDRVGEPA